ncbi:MAG: P-loop NTPase [Candidatus Sifarchaeia archaeon]|jgi:MinD superfamily P-loop ATPase
MKEVVVVSGKGGVGKTSVTAALAILFQENNLSLVALDADVDAPNLALLLSAKDGKRVEDEIEVSEKAFILADNCVHCGQCVESCDEHAIVQPDLEEPPIIIRYLCEGCGKCAVICPETAIEIRAVKGGKIINSKNNANGFPIITGQIVIGETGSGKIVTEIKKRGREEAQKVNADVLLVDGAPGTGCPVIAAITGANYVIIVTEPTPSAMKAFERITHIAQYFPLEIGLIINKSDLHEPSKAQILEIARNNGVEILGEIPLDKNVPYSIAQAEPIVTYAPESPAASALKLIAERLLRSLRFS